MILVSGCASPEREIIDRESAIPADAVKIAPQDDAYPPVLHSDDYYEPVQMPYPVSTAGAEDSPFMDPDGQRFYFFFTPDVRVPVEKQVIDGVTGIYVSDMQEDGWGKPERVFLQDPGKLSLDGCPFVQDDVIWVCSAREGYTGLHWVRAEYAGGGWRNWAVTDFDPQLEVGELHFSSDWTEVYYHSGRPGGKGGLDIWVSRYQDGGWQPPENIAAVNTEATEAMPFLSQDGQELWFNRVYLGSPAVYVSRKVPADGGFEWGEPELVISQFAGEPNLDAAGNIYFVHHFYRDGQMLEADIYVAYRK